MGSRTDPGYYLIMNPGSRGGKSSGLFEQIHAEFQKHGLRYRYTVISSMEEAETLSGEACRDGCDVVVAVGGDGTINRVLNGFYLPDGSLASDAKLGVIYTGTSPDFCLSHGLPVRDVPRAVAALSAFESKPISIGRIHFSGHIPDSGFRNSSGGTIASNSNGNRESSLRHFACCANIGIGPALAESANSGIRGRFGDKMGTFLSLLLTLKNYKPVDLTINGETFSKVYNLSIGKTRYVASGLKIHHDLQPDDGRLYMLCIQNRIPGHIIDLYRGDPLPLKYVSEAVICGDAAVEFDGDPWGKLPVTITTAPAIEVIHERT